MKMFCFQCQKTARNQGCQAGSGVCGKSSETANLQDLLVYIMKGISRISELPEKTVWRKKQLTIISLTACSKQLRSLPLPRQQPLL